MDHWPRIRFCEANVVAFRDASLDHNPLHVSDDYARLTPFGKPVVFGILSALHCFGHLRDRPAHAVSRVDIHFNGAVFRDIDYALEIVSDAGNEAIFKLRDGRRTVLSAAVEFHSPSVVGDLRDLPDAPSRPTAAPLAADALRRRARARGQYQPPIGKLRDLLNVLAIQGKGFGAGQVLALLWSSYLVGMELPGLRSMFAKLDMSFDEDPNAYVDASEPLSYDAEVSSFHEQLDLVEISARLAFGERAYASAKLQAYFRNDVPPVDVHANLEEQASQLLVGKVAVVTGASRGLGANIASALCARGCTVYANYSRSHSEAEQLHAQIPKGHGRLVLTQGDASSPTYFVDLARRLDAEHGRLDFLVCNACPPLQPISLDPDCIGRINAYVEKSLALADIPMAATLPLLTRSRGWNILISSIFVVTCPADWPHYVSAKLAQEGIVRVAAKQFKRVRHLIVRPPRLLTHLSNTPAGHDGAVAPSVIASRIVNTIAEANDSQLGVPMMLE